LRQSGGFSLSFCASQNQSVDRLTLVILASIPLVGLAFAGVGIMRARSGRLQSQAYAAAAAVASEDLGLIRTILAFCTQSIECQRSRMWVSTSCCHACAGSESTHANRTFLSVDFLHSPALPWLSPICSRFRSSPLYTELQFVSSVTHTGLWIRGQACA
jgi:ABC-type multidrug transport system fused ATPase/permease subunit